MKLSDCMHNQYTVVCYENPEIRMLHPQLLLLDIFIYFMQIGLFSDNLVFDSWKVSENMKINGGEIENNHFTYLNHMKQNKFKIEKLPPPSHAPLFLTKQFFEGFENNYVKYQHNIFNCGKLSFKHFLRTITLNCCLTEMLLF